MAGHVLRLIVGANLGGFAYKGQIALTIHRYSLWETNIGTVPKSYLPSGNLKVLTEAIRSRILEYIAMYCIRIEMLVSVSVEMKLRVWIESLIVGIRSTNIDEEELF